MLLAVVVAVLSGLPSAARAAANPGKRVVVLIAIPGLEWSDLADMPALEHFVAGSAVGELSIKTAGSVTRCAAGVLTVGAGNRAYDPQPNCPIPAADWPTLSHNNKAGQYNSTIGLLGTTLQGAGISTIAVGPLAAPMLADEAGTLPTQVPTVGAAVAAAARAPSDGAVIAVLDPGMYYLTPYTVRAPKAQQVDTRLAATLAALPAAATVMVAGISDIASGDSDLHLFAVSGPGWRHVELRSSAAGRAPYVQLIDIAPTILAAEGVAIPSEVVGRPMQQSREGVPAASRFVDDDRHATAQRTLGQRTFLVLGIAMIVLLLLSVLPWKPSRAAAKWLARMLAPAPMLAFVANAFPWWRWGQPAFAGLVIAGAVIIAGATGYAARRGPFAAAAVPLGATLIALVLDQLTGAQLQLSAPLGDSPIVAGRFSGVGGLDFAVIATSALLLGGLVAGRLGGRRGALVGVAIVAVALVVVGAPQLGDKFGGVFTLVPGFLLLAALLFKVKVTARRVLFGVVGTLAIAAAVAVADYSRPTKSQSHIGRFVGQILHGGAGTEVHRKLDAALATFGATTATFVVLVVIITAISSRAGVRAALRRIPGLPAAASAVLLTAVLGAFLNDVGLPITAMAAIVGVSAIYGAVGGTAPRAVATSGQ